MKTNPVQCLICNRIIGCKSAFSRHIKQTHHMTPKEYYDAYLKTDTDGKCLVCGNNTDFISIAYGYKSHCCKKCAYKTAIQKSHASQIEKYGCLAWNSEKQKETVRQLYGVDNVYQSGAIKEKIKQTMIEKYGVDHPMKLKELRNDELA